MLELKLHPLELPLRHAWTIAHGTRTVQRNLVVELHDPQTGLSGFGEAASIPYFGVTVESLLQTLQESQDAVQALPIDHPEQAWASLTPRLGSQRFAQCAVDQAMYDLWGKRCNQPVWQLLNLDRAACPASDYTIGIAPPEVMAAKMQEYPGFPIYKIKLGTGDPRKDLQIVERLRQETDAVFRVDANCAWTADEAIRLSGPLQQLGVEFIEQPLKREMPRSEHARVYSDSDLPIIADESCITEDDVDACAGCFHGINIKLMKAGGMTPGRRMIARARELGLKVMMGCMTETTVGISAIGQLLPMLDYVDMDGALLLAPGSDVADGVRVGPDGIAVFPSTPGNGVTWRGGEGQESLHKQTPENLNRSGAEDAEA